MRARLGFVAALALLCATGCYRIKYTRNQPPAPAPAYDEWHHDFIYGLAEVTPPVNVSQACPNNFSVVEHEMSFVNGLVRALTFSIWTPLTVNVTCSATKAGGDTPLTPVAPSVAQREDAKP